LGVFWQKTEAEPTFETSTSDRD